MRSQDAERVGMLASYEVFESRDRGRDGGDLNVRIRILLIHGVTR
jgi:hypothetical protein